MKAPYQEIGVVNTKDVFKKAMEGGYAVPAYNFNNMEQLQAIIIGCVESKSPVILQVSKGARDYANQTLLRYMAMGAVQMAKEMGSKIPITPAPGPRRLLRAVQVVYRVRFLLGDDRRLAPAVRGEYQAHQAGGGLRESVRRQRRGRAGRPGRHRGRRGGREVQLHRPQAGAGLRRAGPVSTAWRSRSGPRTGPTSSS